MDAKRVAAGEYQAFATLELTLTGKNAKIRKAVFTDDKAKTVKQGLDAAVSRLEKGLNWDGKPMSADERKAAESEVATTRAWLKAGTGAGASFDGKIVPYVRKPKRPTVQYVLTPTTAGIRADWIWGDLGNEGDGGRFLAPPSMVTGQDDHGKNVGHAGAPDIEFEGTQGPGWDRYLCD